MKKNVWIRALALLLALCLLSVVAAAGDALMKEAEMGEYDPMEGAQDNVPPTPRLSDGVQGQGKIDDPDKYWAQNGYPDDISYAYQAGGEVREENGEDVVYAYWEIGVVGADAARRQEILDMLAPVCLVTFVDCRYSYAEREEAAQALRALDDPNILDVMLILNTEKVWVYVAPGMAEQYAASLKESFGEVVEVTDIAPMLEMDRGGSVWQAPTRPGISEGQNTAQLLERQISVWPFALLAVVLAAAVTAETRRVLLLQTAKEGVRTASPRPRKGQVERVVRAASVTPCAKIWERVEREIWRGNDG